LTTTDVVKWSYIQIIPLDVKATGDVIADHPQPFYLRFVNFSPTPLWRFMIQS